MSKRQSLRKKSKEGSTIRRPGKRRWTPKKNLRYQLAYEEGIILRDLAEMGGRATKRELEFRYPMRYHPRQLTVALTRLSKDGALKRRRGPGGPHVYYTREAHAAIVSGVKAA